MRRTFCDLGGFLFVVLAIGLIAAAGQAAAQEGAADDDYPLLGEFRGPISLEPNKYQPLALQVRPTGGGNFQAIQYEGGLPGEGLLKGQPVNFIGRRSGDFLVLSGGPWIVIVETDHCLVLDRHGKQIGRLERVERVSPTMGAQPPKDAVILFDGTSTDQFTKATMTPDGLLMQGADVKPLFQDFNLHLEFLLPYMPAAKGQGRANSGVYLQNRYEVQVLDSFGEEPVLDGCGALYRFRKPDLNMCLPPLKWQTYDIIFTSPRWASDGAKIRNARVTVWLNGVKVHNNVELADKTGSGNPEEPLLLPMRFQDHGNPVHFRNIWLIDRGLAADGRFPVYPPKPEPKPEAKPEPKPEPKPEAKPEPKPQAKPQPKPESKPEAKPEEKKPAVEEKKPAEPKKGDAPKPPTEKPAEKPAEKPVPEKKEAPAQKPAEPKKEVPQQPAEKPASEKKAEPAAAEQKAPAEQKPAEKPAEAKKEAPQQDKPADAKPAPAEKPAASDKPPAPETKPEEQKKAG